MKSITFYKFVSPYPEDITRGCGLTGAEIDRNFFNLKEMDIASVSANTNDSGNTLILTRVDGEKLEVNLGIDLTDCTKNFSVNYDKDNGIITINHDGKSDIISGLSTIYTEKPVYSDATLDGNGLPSSPLKMSPVYMTGEYAPCINLIDETIYGNKLPTSGMNPGDRYLTKEIFTPYGYYYNACQMQEINKYLKDNNSPWRIPTKGDWDAIFDAAEYCDKYRNHTNTGINKDYSVGMVAGKRLKSVDGWTGNTVEIIAETCDLISGTPCDSNCVKINSKGTDDFGFKVLPAGHADNYDSKIDNFSACAYFWTSSNYNGEDNAFYAKQFRTDLATVNQYSPNRTEYNTIRLVRDIDNGNVSPIEQIGDHNYPTVVMSAWTMVELTDNSGNTESAWSQSSSVWTDSNICGKFNLTTEPILPDSGHAGTGLIVYYINHWNGIDWQRAELKEGYSVVLHQGLSGDSENEYRVINGELVNTSEIVYNNVIERLSGTTFKDIYEKISANTEYINELSAVVSSNFNTVIELIKIEESARTNADKALQDELDLTEKALEDEVITRQLEDGLLRTDINSISADLYSFSAKTEAFEDKTSKDIQTLSADVADNKAHLINSGKFDCSGGTLTLNTNDSGNTITIGLTSNYGIYPWSNE